MKKLVCIYNIGGGNTELLATKMRYWQKKGLKIRMVCPQWLVTDFEKLIKNVEYVGIPCCKKAETKIGLIFELLKRTGIAVFFLKRIVKYTTVLYSISSVLDELLLPFFIKCMRKRKK